MFFLTAITISAIVHSVTYYTNAIFQFSLRKPHPLCAVHHALFVKMGDPCKFVINKLRLGIWPRESGVLQLIINAKKKKNVDDVSLCTCKAVKDTWFWKGELTLYHFQLTVHGKPHTV